MFLILCVGEGLFFEPQKKASTGYFLFGVYIFFFGVLFTTRSERLTVYRRDCFLQYEEWEREEEAR